MVQHKHKTHTGIVHINTRTTRRVKDFDRNTTIMLVTSALPVATNTFPKCAEQSVKVSFSYS
jgi:hypothetical protein